MIRNIKALGLAFVAVAAMSAFAVSAAQGSELHAQTAKGANITGEQEPGQQLIFKYTGPSAETKCTQVTFEGTAKDVVQPEPADGQTTSQELTLTPTITGCKTFGLASVLDMNGCKYTITNKTAAGVTTALKATVDITGCTAGKQIEVTASGCTIRVPEQHNLNDLGFVNLATVPKTVTMNITIQGITYQLTGALCPGTTGVLTHDGDITGSVTLKAFVDNGTLKAIHTNQFNGVHNQHEYDKLICGAQVDLFAT
jgi:hypothetical protein